MKRIIKLTFLRTIPGSAFILLYLATTLVYGNNTSITLRWEANTDPDLSGYRAYFRTGASGNRALNSYDGTGLIYKGQQVASGFTINKSEFPNSPPDPVTISLSNLDTDKMFYFVVTSYSDTGLESIASNETAWASTQEDTMETFNVIGSSITNAKRIQFPDKPDYGEAKGYYGNEATVTIAVSPVNDPPAAKAETYAISKGSSLFIDAVQGVLANDSDPDGDSLAASLVSDVSYGTLTLSADGSFTYVHDGSQNTRDSFIYMVDDGNGGSDQNIVTLVENKRVTNGQLALYTFDEGQGTIINDISGSGTPLDLTISDGGAVNWLPGGGLEITSDTVISSASPATKIIDSVKSSQAITIEAWVKPADTGQTGPARILALSEGPNVGTNFMLGQSQTRYTVRLRTTTTNQFGGDPSVESPDDALTDDLTHMVYAREVDGDVWLYVNGILVESSIVDGDLSNWNDAYTLNLANEPTLDRSWLGELHLLAIYDRALNYIEVGQNFADKESATHNTAPMTNGDSYTVSEGGSINTNLDGMPSVLANDMDPDGDFLTAELLPGFGPQRGTLTLNSDGSFLYTHDGSETSADSFTYFASDGNGGTSKAQVTLSVVASNDPPDARDDNYYVARGGTINTQLDNLPRLLANDNDPDGDSLSSLLLSNVSEGTLVLNSDGSFIYTHGGGNNGSDSFTYEADDGNGGIDTATVSLGIDPVNFPPVAKDDSYTVGEGGTLTVDSGLGVLANDIDQDGGDQKAFLDEDNGPLNGILTLRPDGSFTYQHDNGEISTDHFTYLAGHGSMTYSPAKDFNGTDTFSYTLQDSSDVLQVVTVTVEVTAINDPPVAGDITATTGEDYSIYLTPPVNDVDGDFLTYVFLDQPAHGTLLGTGPTFIYRPDANYYGAESFTYKVNDGQTDSNIATVLITVFADSDEDGMPDAWETNNGVSDPYGDPDGDSLINRVEYINGTDPLAHNQLLPDTDGDGIPDSWEQANGLDPALADETLDPDMDGLSNLEEYQNGTNPFLIDSDDDGIGDITEVTLTTNPRDPNSVPQVSLVTSNLWVTDVTPRSFSLVWKSNQSATCSTIIYSDPDGLNPVTGVTIIDDSFAHPPASNIGVMKVNASGLNPDTTYYFQLVTVSGSTVLVEPARGQLPSVRTEISSAPVSNDLLAQQILQDDGISSADGFLFLAEFQGGSYPVTGWVGDGILSPWAYVDLNNIYSLNASTNLQLLGGEHFSLWSFGGAEGDYVNIQQIPAPSGVIQVALPDASYLSKEPGYYLDLKVDLNIVGLPVYPTQPFTAHSLLLHLADQAGGDPSVVVSIRRFNPQSAIWETASWFLGQPSGVDFLIEPGEAYLIYMKRDLDDVWFEGVAVGTAVDLAPGLNLVCLPSPRQGFDYDSYEMLDDLGDSNEVYSVKRYDSLYGWQTTSWFLGSASGALYDTRKGEGYVVYMKQGRSQWRPY